MLCGSPGGGAFSVAGRATGIEAGTGKVTAGGPFGPPVNGTATPAGRLGVDFVGIGL